MSAISLKKMRTYLSMLMALKFRTRKQGIGCTIHPSTADSVLNMMLYSDTTEDNRFLLILFGRCI